MAAGEVVVRVADSGSMMYLIGAGAVEVRFDGGKAAKELGPGQYFGEIALFTGGSARTATAVATRKGVLYAIDHAAIERLEHDDPRLVCALLHHTCTYLVASEQGLIGDLQRRNRELEQALDYLRRTREELSATELEANTDALTGLYNRRCLSDQIPKFMSRAAQRDARLYLVLVDLDRFKPVNDTYGHAAGDAVLRSLGAVIRDSVRERDLPCRIGGDEFAILMSEIGPEVARERAERLRGAIAALRFPGIGPDVRIDASISATRYRAGDSESEFFARGDKALYEAKSAGRGRVSFIG
jgi:diguanylate cyclase (GGDEF)-like protein